MKKLILFLAIALFALAGFVQASPEAPEVLWVSNCWNETEPHDQGFIDLLAANGFTVTRWSTTAPFNLDPKNIDATTQALANTYDLVIVGRHGGSGYADNDAERALWNGITAPMIVTGSYNTRYNRWKMLDGNTGTVTTAPLTAILPSDPVFAGVTLDENDAVDFVDYATGVVNTTSGGNGTIVGVRTVEGGEYPFIVRWPAGAEYYEGAGQYAGGRRMVFHCGTNGGGDGRLNLTAQGQLMFVNAAYDMSGATFDRSPITNAGLDQITNIGVPVQLDGTAFDFEGAATITWSGPGAVTFSDTTIEDPTVTCDAAGIYTLHLQVDDGVNPLVTDTMTIYVRDPASDAAIAHWDFESLPDPNSLTDVTTNGFTGIWNSPEGDPNVVLGVLNNGTSQAADLAYTDGFWEVPNAVTVTTDPNFNQIATGNTFAAWIKIDPAVTPQTGFPVIAAFDTSSARFQLQGQNVYYSIGSAYSQGTRTVYDNLWHHVVGVYDGVNSTLSVYLDGVMDSEPTVVPAGTLCGVGLGGEIANNLRIGNRQANRQFHGQIDDLQVYNYPLTDAEIAALTAEGDVPLSITAGEDQVVNFKNQPVQLAGVGLVDDGKPVATTYLWELTAYPLGVDPNDIIINNPGAVDTTVTFPKPPIEGGYIFTLTADDTVAPVSDTVQITINIPTCQDVITDGLTSMWDLVGGPLDSEGNPTPDCRVDLQDFAAFAAQWLECVDPSDPSCTSAY